MNKRNRRIAVVASVAAVLIVAGLALGMNHAKPHTVSHAAGNSGVVIRVGTAKPLFSMQQDKIYQTAEQLVHNPPSSGFDASGFVQYVYGKAGIQLPRTIAEQAHTGTVVNNRSQLQRGDLVFFNLNNSGQTATFVGIYLGGNEFAAQTTHGLMNISLNQPYWSKAFRYGERVN